MRLRALPIIIIVALAILVAPLAATAQPPAKVYRIGYLATIPPPAHLWEALLDGLRERGYSEGRNLVFERRFSEGNTERFSAFAAEMVQLRVDCIIAITTPAALAVKHATTTIPIVMTTAIDPVGAGLVASLARPGGNVTGNAILYAGTQHQTFGAPQGRRARPLPRGGPLECGESRQRVGVARDAGGGTRVGPPAPRAGRAGRAGLRRARSPARPRRTRRRSSSWTMRSSLCTAKTSRSSPPRSTCRACLPPGNRSWPAV